MIASVPLQLLRSKFQWRGRGGGGGAGRGTQAGHQETNVRTMVH